MTGGLVIRLKPHEKFLINGAILENGDRRTKLHIKSQEVNILRLRDAMHPSEATTPVKRLYYCAQLAVSGDRDGQSATAQLMPGLRDLLDAMPATESADLINDAIVSTNNREFFRVMKLMKKLLPLEEKLLAFARAGELSALDANIIPCSRNQSQA